MFTPVFSLVLPLPIPIHQSGLPYHTAACHDSGKIRETQWMQSIQCESMFTEIKSLGKRGERKKHTNSTQKPPCEAKLKKNK